jgi:WD40 repeat protein
LIRSLRNRLLFATLSAVAIAGLFSTLAPPWWLPAPQPRAVLPGSTSTWYGGTKIAFSPDSSLIAATDGPRPDEGRQGSVAPACVCLWEVNTGKLRRELINSPFESSGPAFSMDGAHVMAFHVIDTPVPNVSRPARFMRQLKQRYWDVESGQELGRLASFESFEQPAEIPSSVPHGAEGALNCNMEYAAYSPRSGNLAWVADDEVLVLHAAMGTIRPLTRSTRFREPAMVISPDGQQLAVSRVIEPALGKRWLDRLWSWINGSSAATDRYVLSVFDVRDGQELVRFPSRLVTTFPDEKHQQDYEQFSPDGKTFAVQRRDGISLYDAPFHRAWTDRMIFGVQTGVAAFVLVFGVLSILAALARFRRRSRVVQPVG